MRESAIAILLNVKPTAASIGQQGRARTLLFATRRLSPRPQPRQALSPEQGQRRDKGDDQHEQRDNTIRVSSGGDGPKVEIATRRGPRPEAEASANPNDQNN